ncbi:hypothetical protein [Salipaludibacillus sp. CF4.18]|uniref:hypothetical protein n=1 Tax=Salipaludibacillus sp. CF4.18 TaxID=3373081 RepID=UPI003EE6BDF7
MPIKESIREGGVRFNRSFLEALIRDIRMNGSCYVSNRHMARKIDTENPNIDVEYLTEENIFICRYISPVEEGAK